MSVEKIFISADAGGMQHQVDEIELVAGKGIVGDRNFGASKWPGQNLTLIEAEEIDVFLHEHQLPKDLSITRRNIITRGVRLNDLVGKEFLVGEVLLKGVELCEPCRSLGEALSPLINLTDRSTAMTPKAVVTRMMGRGGLRTDVLTSGTIAVGAKIGL